MRDATASSDNFSQIVGMDDQLDDRLGAFVHEQLDGHLFGIRNQLAGKKREQLGCAPMAGPWIAGGDRWAALAPNRRSRRPRSG